MFFVQLAHADGSWSIENVPVPKLSACPPAKENPNCWAPIEEMAERGAPIPPTSGHGPYPMLDNQQLGNSVSAPIEPIGNTWISTRGDPRGFWTTISQADQDLIDARAICANHRHLDLKPEHGGRTIVVWLKQGGEPSGDVTRG
jgi:hypothetical protein